MSDDLEKTSDPLNQDRELRPERLGLRAGLRPERGIGGAKAGKSSKAPGLERVRARLEAQLDELEDVQDLEFIELVATLPHQPYSEEVAVEVLLTVADYVALARAWHEVEVEKLCRTQPEGRRPK